MSMNGNSLQHMLEGVKQMHDEKAREIDTLTAALDARRAELRQITGVLRAAGMLEETPRKEKERKPKGVSEKTLDAVTDAILKLEGRALPGVPGSFTVSQIKSTGMGMTLTTIRLALEKLRNDGLLRVAGSTPGENGGRAAAVFAMVNQ